MSVTYLRKPLKAPPPLPGIPSGVFSWGLTLRQRASQRVSVADEADVVIETNIINTIVSEINSFCNQINPINPSAAIRSIAIDLSVITDATLKAKLKDSWLIQLHTAGFTAGYVAPHLNISVP